MIMNKLYLEPSSLCDDIVISEDTTLRYFLAKTRLEEKQNLVILVKENVTLDFTMVDFSLNNISMNLDVQLERGAKVIVSLASISFNSIQKIFHMNVKHTESDSFSRVNMSGINTGDGILKFLGNSHIVNGAHRSDTRQEGKITNLSPDCKSEVSPSLLIKENDVSASHGAALGAYNPDQLFYLMTRGLSMDEAKKLITFGTLLPMIEKLQDEDLVSQAKNFLEALDI